MTWNASAGTTSSSTGCGITICDAGPNAGGSVMALADTTGIADRSGPLAVASPAAVVCAASASSAPLSFARVGCGFGRRGDGALEALDHRRQAAISQPGAHELPRDREQQDRRGGQNDLAPALPSPRVK